MRIVADDAVAFLPLFGTDFGKGAVRWYALGFASVQPSEFLKPGFVVVAAWLIIQIAETILPPFGFTDEPARITVMRSATDNTSLSLWVIKMIETPRSANSRIMRNRSSPCCGATTAVG